MSCHEMCVITFDAHITCGKAAMVVLLCYIYDVASCVHDGDGTAQKPLVSGLPVLSLLLSACFGIVLTLLGTCRIYRNYTVFMLLEKMTNCWPLFRVYMVFYRTTYPGDLDPWIRPPPQLYPEISGVPVTGPRSSLRL
ncbi:hypothetical protein ACQKWADRAFT_142131 [Trichoderma austrokoningii]